MEALLFSCRKPERNPWFREYWEQKFSCTFNSTSQISPFHNFTKECGRGENLKQHGVFKQGNETHFVREAVLAYAHSLKALHREKCGFHEGLCDAIHLPISGEEVFKYLTSVTFRVSDMSRFHFTEHYNGPPRYTIMTLERVQYHSRHQHAKVEWRAIGNFSRLHGHDNLTLDTEWEEKYKRGIKKSSCREECQIHQAKIMLSDGCCWECKSCHPYQLVQRDCLDCDPARELWPNDEGTECRHITDEEHLELSHIGSVVAMAFACVGVAATLIIAMLFRIHSETPVIKASGRELSYCLLVSVFVSYASVFAFVAPPLLPTCILTRFLIGFTYTFSHATILTKTNRISRIFSLKGQVAQKTKYTSPCSQIIITAAIVFIQVAILLTWLFIKRPTIQRIYPEMGDFTTYERSTKYHPKYTLICQGLNDESYLVAFIYPFFLIVLCTMYAFKTRKCPDGFNEARYIAFTNYTTCIIWLAFLPTYFLNQNNEVRIITLCLSVGLCATVILCCLFLPKLYIVLWRPHKNTRENVMQRKSSAGYSGSLGSKEKPPATTCGELLAENVSELKQTSSFRHHAPLTGGVHRTQLPPRSSSFSQLTSQQPAPTSHSANKHNGLQVSATTGPTHPDL